MSVLIEIGADVNAGESGESPLCIAVHSGNKKMVESLLEHNIANVNIREALKISWELKLDFITGLLLEHIAVDRSRDSVNLSGLELTILKPLWILPSLGVKTLPEAEHHRRHRKQQSLGHVKDFLVRRKSSAIESPFDLGVDSLSHIEGNNRDSRKMSVDFKSLKYVSDVEVNSETEDTDFGGCGLATSKRTLRESTFNSTSDAYDGMNPILTQPKKRSMEYCTDDSGVETVDTLHQQTPCSLESPVDKKSGPIFGVVSRGTLQRDVNGTLSGATTLPNSTLDEYTLDSKGDENSSTTTTAHNQYSNASVTLSASQLFRKLRNHHSKTGKHHWNESSSSNFTDSPTPVMFYQQEGLDANLRYKENSTKVEDSFLGHSDSSQVVSQNGSSPSTHAVSKSLSINTSNDSSLEGGMDAVDFHTCEAIPEEPSFTDGENLHLIKTLDLSSNQLCSFNTLLYSRFGGDLVFKQMKNVSSLDLKQNNLSELLGAMMKVFPCIHYQSIVCI